MRGAQEQAVEALVARERTFAAANAARSRDVTQAYAQGATSTPRASDDVFEAARAWRREARAAYGDVAALGPAAFQRSEALRAYASLDAAIGHLLKALAARSESTSQTAAISTSVLAASAPT